MGGFKAARSEKAITSQPELQQVELRACARVQQEFAPKAADARDQHFLNGDNGRLFFMALVKAKKKEDIERVVGTHVPPFQKDQMERMRTFGEHHLLGVQIRFDSVSTAIDAAGALHRGDQKEAERHFHRARERNLDQRQFVADVHREGREMATPQSTWDAKQQEMLLAAASTAGFSQQLLRDMAREWNVKPPEATLQRPGEIIARQQLMLVQNYLTRLATQMQTDGKDEFQKRLEQETDDKQVERQ